MPTFDSLPRRLLLALFVFAAGAALAVVLEGERIASWLAGSGGASEDEEVLHQPPGFWTVAPLATARRARGDDGGVPTDVEERARLVSLPYLGGRARAADDGRGVVVHRPDRVSPGVNLYNSGHGPEAILIDIEGRSLHRWRYPFERAFPEERPTADTPFFRRVHLFPDGRLLALYQTGGLVFLDRRSRPLGTCAGNFYNDLWVAEEPGGGGRIWTLAKEAHGAEAAVRLDDFLVLLRYDGAGERCRETHRISLTRALARSPFAGLLEPMAPRGDVLHANTVVELGPEVAAIPGLPAAFAPGRLLVSLREIDVIVVIDPVSEVAVWARRGPWRAQHEPSLLADGRLLLFDNRGGAGGLSRLLAIDPENGKAVWSWQGDPPESFHSPIGGTVADLPGGNTLATLSVPGRALEIDPGGEVVWELDTPHRAGPEDELIAMLFEVQRLPREHVEGWLR